MALPIKSVINRTHSHIQQIFFQPNTSALRQLSSKSVINMIEHGIVPDVIAFVPGDKIQVKHFNWYSVDFSTRHNCPDFLRIIIKK